MVVRRYPLSEQALDRLLATRGLVPQQQPSSGPLGAAWIRSPKLRKDRKPTLSDNTTQERSALHEDLLQMALVGNSADGDTEVNFAFQQDVLRGASLVLQFSGKSIRACFKVPDDTVRRMIEGHIDGLVARLRDRGFVVESTRIDVGPGNDS